MMIHGSLRTHDKLMSSFETGHTGGKVSGEWSKFTGEQNKFAG